MTKQSIEILYAVSNYKGIKNQDSKRLVIIESRVIGYINKTNCGPFLSFEELTAEDFFEIYRYKKSLERDKDKKGND